MYLSIVIKKNGGILYQITNFVLIVIIVVQIYNTIGKNSIMYRVKLHVIKSIIF